MLATIQFRIFSLLISYIRRFLLAVFVIMILSCVLVTGDEHILCCVYVCFQIGLLTSVYYSLCVFIFGIFALAH
jgi:hypothetical protein